MQTNQLNSYQITVQKTIRMKFILYLSENHWNHVPAVSVPTFKAQRTEVKMFICTACCLTDLACLIHSMKCCSIWSLCLCATRGNTNPYSRTELSITATPNGRGPGIGSLWKKKLLDQLLKTCLVQQLIHVWCRNFTIKMSYNLSCGKLNNA